MTGDSPDVPGVDDAPTAAEILAEMTGRPVEEFELTEDMEFPELDELESTPAPEWYSDESD